MLFGDDDFQDDESEGFDEEEVWKVEGPSTATAEGQYFPLPTSGLHVPPMVSDVEVAPGITIGEISPRVSSIEGQRDVQIQQLRTLVFEMSSSEITLMQCIIRMDRRLANLERRPPGPQ
nr:hypothetical protein [Tanacetum cinerariifolium]